MIKIKTRLLSLSAHTLGPFGFCNSRTLFVTICRQIIPYPGMSQAGDPSWPMEGKTPEGLKVYGHELDFIHHLTFTKIIKPGQKN